MLIIIFGLPGTGKTFFASALSEALKCRHLNTDIIRKEIVKDVDYSPEGRRRIYYSMLNTAEEYLRKGENLILDGTFLKKELREELKKMSLVYNEPVRFIEMKADEKEILKRVSRKRDYTDADFKVYQKLKQEYEPFEGNHLILWSDKMELLDMITQAKAFLENRSV